MASSEYTEQDRHNEGCCWTWTRDLCKGKGCLCACHAVVATTAATNADEMMRAMGRAERAEREADDLRSQLAASEAARAAAVAERDAARQGFADLKVMWTQDQVTMTKFNNALASAVAERDNIEAVLWCYWFALVAISAADKDDGHDEHEDCPGAVAAAAIQAARKLTAASQAAAASSAGDGEGVNSDRPRDHSTADDPA